jgi:hypothetical protein
MASAGLKEWIRLGLFGKEKGKTSRGALKRNAGSGGGQALRVRYHDWGGPVTNSID